MTKAFNLLDERWLPVRLHDGHVRDVGLLELFERANEISALAETSPPSLIAEYRLLLAITHRALASALDTWKDVDRARWYREGLPTEAIREYLEHWREHFWLFHPEQPFMQVAALEDAQETRDNWKPWTQIALESATYGDGPTLFDHTVSGEVVAADPGKVLRNLLGFLQFALPGTIRVFRHSDNAGPLTNTAAVIPVGQCLSETLCLSLHPAPFITHEDLPCWERRATSIAELRAGPSLASGANDRYTRLSRAVLLAREPGGRVKWLRFGAGVAINNDSSAPDPMVSYRSGQESLVKLTFREGRAFWRDLPVLMPEASGRGSHPAAVLSYACNVHSCMTSTHIEQPLIVAGVASSKAKLLRWRSELLRLPVTLLADSDNALALKQFIHKSESQFEGLRNLATDMLADILPKSKRRERLAYARNLFDNGSATAIYFAAAERSLGVAMTLLCDGKWEQAERLWCQALIIAAEKSWAAARLSMGQSTRALRADARHWPRFCALLKKDQPKPEPDMAVLAEDA